MHQKSLSILLLTAALLGLPVVGSKSLLAPAIAQPITLSGDWILQSFGDAANPSEILPETAITVRFADGALSGSAGCNSYRSRYETQNRRLQVAPVATTRKLCAPEVMAQEAAFITALQTARKYRLNDQGQLQIRYKTEAGGQILTFVPPVAVFPLAGTQWQVVEWADRPSAPITAALTANFSDQGRLSGSGGCNNFLAPYQTTGDVLTIGLIASTLRACIIDVSQQESAYFAALQNVRRYQINDQGQLQLFYTADSETKTITLDPQ